MPISAKYIYSFFVCLVSQFRYFLKLHCVLIRCFLFSRAILSTTFFLDLKNSFLHDSDWISFFLFHVQSRKWIWKPEATKNKWILRENIFYLHPCSVRVHVVILCPDTLHPLPSFAFREGILVLHVPHVSFWRKSLGMGGGAVTNRSVLSFLFFLFFLLFSVCFM